MIEIALRKIVAENAELLSQHEGRVHPIRLPQNLVEPELVMPAITYSRISTPNSFTTHDTLGSVGLREAHFQFDCWGLTYEQSKTLAISLLDALNGYRGEISDVNIGAILNESEIDDFVSDINVYRVIQDYLILYQEI